MALLCLFLVSWSCLSNEISSVIKEENMLPYKMCFVILLRSNLVWEALFIPSYVRPQDCGCFRVQGRAIRSCCFSFCFMLQIEQKFLGYMQGNIKCGRQNEKNPAFLPVCPQMWDYIENNLNSRKEIPSSVQ